VFLGHLRVLLDLFARSAVARTFRSSGLDFWLAICAGSVRGVCGECAGSVRGVCGGCVGGAREARGVCMGCAGHGYRCKECGSVRVRSGKSKYLSFFGNLDRFIQLLRHLLTLPHGLSFFVFVAHALSFFVFAFGYLRFACRFFVLIFRVCGRNWNW
jgi:hypothetical protein